MRWRRRLPVAAASRRGATVDFGAQAGDTLELRQLAALHRQGEAARRQQGRTRRCTSSSRRPGSRSTTSDVIQGNADFFGKIQPQLAGRAGHRAGTSSSSRTAGSSPRLIVERMGLPSSTPSMRPNFDANAATWAKDPDRTIPGTSSRWPGSPGSPGSAGTTSKVEPAAHEDGRPDEPRHRRHELGRHAEGRHARPRDDQPRASTRPTSTPDDWKDAADWLQKQQGLRHGAPYYDQGYIDDLTAGNLSATHGVVRRRPLLQDLGGYANLRVRRARGRRAPVDRQHADPGRRGESRGRLPADGLRLQARDRARWSPSGCSTCRRCRRCRT